MTSHFDPTYIVGIGASIEGLAELEGFFRAMPAESGMAFVLVLDPAPGVTPQAEDLLARYTTMPIRRVENEMELTANTIYLLPSRQLVTVTESHLHLQERGGTAEFMPLDSFFESLAGAAQSRAIGIILAETGSDGARGIRAIHEAGGLVLVKSTESAQFDGMPRAAIYTGLCDYVTTPAAMPALLLAYAQNPGDVRAMADELNTGLSRDPIDRRALHDYEQIVNRLLHAGVLLDEHFQVLSYFGAIGQYLKPPAGRPGTDIAHMVVDDLHLALSEALLGASTLKGRFSRPGVMVHQGETAQWVDLSVDCIPYDQTNALHYLVTLTPVISPEPPPSLVESSELQADLEKSQTVQAHISDLELDLHSEHEILQATIEELRTDIEELQAANEELLASNEELQSANEKLRTLNEELHIVNAEHEKKNLELQVLNEDHERLLESLEVGVVFLDEQLAIRKFNAASALAFRLMPNNVGRPIDHIAYQLADRDDGALFTHLHEVLTSGETREREVRTQDGKWLLKRIFPYFDARHEVRGVILTFTDVTRLKADEARLRTLFELLPVGVAILNKAGQVVDSNPKVADITALSQEALTRGEHAERRYVHPDGSEMRQSEFASARVTTEGKPVYDIETGIVKEDGSLTWTSVSAAPLPDGGVVVVTADITTRKQAEQELKRWADIFQNVSFGFVVGSPDDKNLGIMNPAFARMHGYTMEELIGTPIANVFAPESRPELPEHIRLIHDTGHHTWEAKHLRKDGTVFPVLVDAVAVKDESGTIRYRVVSVRDITKHKQAEETLRIALTKYQTLFDTFPLGVTVTDESGSIIETNRVAEKLLGISEKEQKQREIDGAEWLIIRPDGTPMPAEEYASVRALKEAAKVENVEMGVVKPTGDVTWINVSAAPLPVEGHGVVVTYGDITERKQAESALKRSERLLNETGQIAKIGGWELDVATMKQEWTDATYDIHDRERGAYYPNSTEEINKFEPGSKERIEAAFEEAIRQGTPYDLEVEMTTIKGNRKWVRAVCHPILTDGKVTRLTGTVQDITERKTIEQQLQESERNYRELVQNANSAIIRWRSDGTIAFFNEYAQTLFGYRSAEILGKPVGVLVPATDSSGGDLSTLVQNIVDHPDDFVNVVNENICRDGRRVWMAWTNKPVYDEHGQVSEILAVGGDITSRKRIEDELRRSNAELEQFAYIASHDLQEPLRTVAGMVQLLQQRYQSQLDERADEYIHFAVDASKRMQQLINDLLDFSRVDRKERSFAATDVEQTLQRVLANLQSTITESGAQITHDPLPTVQADAEQLTQVLQNLVGNAIKFRGDQPPEIHIGAERSENCWQFAVRDNGIGIDPKYFERIFLIFQRLHTRRKYPGTGIGLAICKKIIERHGGKIWVESEPNHGAIFFFTLPERTQA